MPSGRRRRQDTAANHSRTLGICLLLKKLLRWLRVNSLRRSVNTEAQREPRTRRENSSRGGKVAVGIWFCFISRLIFELLLLKSSCGYAVFFYADGKLAQRHRSQSPLMNDFLPTPGHVPVSGEAEVGLAKDSSDPLVSEWFAVRLRFHMARCSDVQVAYRAAPSAAIHHKNTQYTR